MNSNFLVYMVGVIAMIGIYFVTKLVTKRFFKNRREISFHLVERLLIFALTVVLLLVAIFIK